MSESALSSVKDVVLLVRFDCECVALFERIVASKRSSS